MRRDGLHRHDRHFLVNCFFGLLQHLANLLQVPLLLLIEFYMSLLTFCESLTNLSDPRHNPIEGWNPRSQHIMIETGSGFSAACLGFASQEQRARQIFVSIAQRAKSGLVRIRTISGKPGKALMMIILWILFLHLCQFVVHEGLRRRRCRDVVFIIFLIVAIVTAVVIDVAVDMVIGAAVSISSLVHSARQRLRQRVKICPVLLLHLILRSTLPM